LPPLSHNPTPTHAHAQPSKTKGDNRDDTDAHAQPGKTKDDNRDDTSMYIRALSPAADKEKDPYAKKREVNYQILVIWVWGGGRACRASGAQGLCWDVAQGARTVLSACICDGRASRLHPRSGHGASRSCMSLHVLCVLHTHAALFACSPDTRRTIFVYSLLPLPSSNP